MDLGSAHGRIEFLYDPGGIARAKGDLESLGQAGNNVGQQMTKVGGAMLGVGGAISAGVGLATGMAANFEQQMDAVNASLDTVGLTSGEVESQMAGLSETALRIGKDTQFSAQEAGQAMEELAKLGFTAEEIMGGAADATVDLAAATGTDMVVAAEAMGAVLNTFDPAILGFEQGINSAADAADTLTAAVNASAVDLPQLMAGMRPLGAQMALVGASFEDTAAAVAYFSNFGLRAADVGVSLARGIENLVDPTSEAAGILEDFGIQIKAFAEDGSFVGLPAIMDQLGESMKNLTAEEKALALTSIFGAEAVDVMGIAALTSGDGLREMTEQVQANGQAAAAAAIRMDNLKGAAEQLSGSIETAAIAFGTPLLGAMRSTTEGITALVNSYLELDPATQAVISKTIALTGTLLGIGGSALIAAGYFVKLAQALGLSQTAALRFVGAFGLIGALAALAAGAYATNFLGFGDTVRRVAGNGVKALSTFIDEFKSLQLLFRGSGFNKAAAAVRAFGAAFTDAFGIDIEGFTDRMSDGIQGFTDTFQGLTERGVQPAIAALFGLAQALDEADFEGAADLVENLAQSAANFAAEFKASGDEARAAGYDGIADDIIAFGDALDYVTGLPVEPAFRRIADVIQTMQDAFTSAQEQGLGPFTSGIEALKAGLEEVTGIDIKGFADGLGEFGSNLREVAEAVVGNNLGQALDQLGTTFRELGDAIGPQIQEALNNIASTIQSIDIAEIAVNIGTWALGKFEDLKTWLDTNVVQKLEALDLGTVAAEVGGWLISLGEGALDVATEVKNWTLEQIAKIPPVDLGTIAATILGWTVTAKEALSDKVVEIVEGAKSALGQARTTLGTIGATIEGWLVTQQTALSDKVFEIVEGAKSAIAGIPFKLGEIRTLIETWAVDEGLPLATEIQTKAVEFAGNTVAKIPEVTANIVSWFVTGFENLATAIQGALSGSPEGGGSFRGSPGVAGVTLENIKATILSFLPDVATALTALPGQIKDQLSGVTVPLDEVKATIGSFAAEIGDSAVGLGEDIKSKLGTVDVPGVAANLTEIAFEAGADAVTGVTQAINDALPDTVNADVIKAIIPLKFEIKMPDAPFGPGNPLEGVATEFEGYVQELSTRFATALADPKLIPAEAFNLGSDLGSKISDGIDVAVRAISGKGDEIKSALINLGGAVTGGVVLAGAAIRLAGVSLGAFLAGLVSGIIGYDDELMAAGEGLKAAFEGIREAIDLGLEGMIKGTGQGRDTYLGGTDPLADIFKPLLESMQQTVDDFIQGMQRIGDTLTGEANPFKGIIETVQGWIDQMQHDLQNMLFGFSPEGGGSFRGGHAGIAQQFVDAVTGMFEGIGPAVDAAIAKIPNPLEGLGEQVKTWFQEALSGTGEEVPTEGRGEPWRFTEALTGFADQLFGASETEAAELSPEAQADITRLGESFGKSIAGVFSSDAFKNSVTTALEEVPTEQFAAVGQAFMTKLTEGIGAALTTAEQPTQVSEPGAASGMAAGMAESLQGIFTGMVQPLVTAAQALDVAIFAPVGQALMAKIQEGIASALTASKGGGGQGALGTAPVAGGAGIGADLAKSIVDPIIQGLVTGFDQGFPQVGAAVDQGMLTITQAFSNGATSISSASTQIISTVATLTTGMTTSLDNGATMVTAAVGRIGAAIQTLVPLIQEAAAAASSAIASFVTGIVTQMDTGVTQVSAAAGRMGAAAMEVVPALNAAAAAAGQAAIGIGQAIVSALDAAVPQVAAAAGRLGAASVVPIDNAIQSGSPSKVVLPWAESIPEALIQGITQGIEAVKSVASALGTAATEGIQVNIEGVTPEVISAVQTMVDSVLASLQSGLSSLGTEMDTFLQNMIGLADQAGVTGEQVGQSLATGLSSALDTIKGAATEIGSAIQTGLNDIATAAGESGTELSANYTAGIEGGTPSASQASYDMGQETLKGLAESLREKTNERIEQWRAHAEDIVSKRRQWADDMREKFDITIEGEVVMDGEAMGRWTNEVTLGNLMKVPDRGGRRNSRRNGLPS